VYMAGTPVLRTLLFAVAVLADFMILMQILK
jgi:hypothetical protein